MRSFDRCDDAFMFEKVAPRMDKAQGAEDPAGADEIAVLCGLSGFAYPDRG